MQSKSAKKYFKERKGAVYNTNKKKGAFAFEFLSPNKLPAGVYYFHLLPKHPEKCPSGEEYISTGKLPDEDKEWGISIMLGDSTGQPCYLTDMTKALDINGRFKKLPEVVRDKLSWALDPFDKLRYPTAWLLDIINEEKPAPTKEDPKAVKNVKVFKSNPNKEMEQGIILDVWQKGINEEIQGILDEFPDIRDPDDGRCIKLICKGEGKERRYKVSVSKKRALKNTSLLKKSYPDLGKFNESMIFDYPSQKIMFLERMPKNVLDALEKVGINLDDPLGSSKKSKKAIKEMDEEDEIEDDDDFDEDDGDEDEDSDSDDSDDDDWDDDDSIDEDDDEFEDDEDDDE